MAASLILGFLKVLGFPHTRIESRNGFRRVSQAGRTRATFRSRALDRQLAAGCPETMPGKTATGSALMADPRLSGEISVSDVSNAGRVVLLQVLCAFLI
jgi:hypothetical protein